MRTGIPATTRRPIMDGAARPGWAGGAPAAGLKRAWPHPAYRDALFVLLASFAVFALAGWIEFDEIFARWAAPYESWQLDELPATLLVFSAGLAWFAWRRLAEAQAEARSRAAAEEESARLLRHNRALAQQLLTLQEDERRALARELHDEAGQYCTAIRANAACMMGALDAAQPGDATVRAGAQAIAQCADQLYDTVHGMLRRLRPATLDALGLAAALDELCSAWQQRHGLSCSLTWLAGTREPGEATRIAAYRLVQESLTNIARHAQARRVTVAAEPVYPSPGTDARVRLRLTVQDDGRGIDAGHSDGMGLLGMRERVAALGGAMHLASAPGAGTRIEVLLPYDTEDAAA